jgi:signal transduction histidine kinase
VLADTGFGIPADKIGTLFDPLVTHKQGGFGIGLALARQIVQRYAGQISLSSESGQGTMVRIELPSVQDVD